MALTGFFAKNKTVDEQISKPEKEITRNLSSINIESSLVDLLKDELEKEEIFFEISNNGNSAKLQIDKNDREIVSEIVEECRNFLTKKNIQTTEKNKSLDEKTKEADRKRGNICSLELSPTLRIPFEQRLKDKNIWFESEEKEEKIFLYFRKSDETLVAKEVEKFNEEIKKQNMRSKLTSILVDGSVREVFGNILHNQDIWCEFHEENNEIYLVCKHEDAEKIETLYAEFLRLAREAEEEMEREEELERKEKQSASKVTETKKGKKKGKQSLGRTEQLKARFTPEEMEKIQERIKSTRKRQGDFVREMMIEGYVKAFPSHANDLLMIEELQKINTQLGKLTGAMVKVMQQTKEEPSMTETEKKEFQTAINSMKGLRTEVKKVLKEIWE